MGALAYGFASEFLGLRIPVLAGAAICAVVWVWTWSHLPHMAAILEAPVPLPGPRAARQTVG
jgi:hypothetical protein